MLAGFDGGGFNLVAKPQKHMAESFCADGNADEIY